MFRRLSRLTIIMLLLSLTACMTELQTGGVDGVPGSSSFSRSAQTPSLTPSLTPDANALVPSVMAPTTISATPFDPLVVATVESIPVADRWRMQQSDRLVFDSMRYFMASSTQLWWYDPISQQYLIVGLLSGQFQVQAQFRLAGQEVTALEVPYEVNVSYGLTALSPALLERIAAVGYESGWIETYVFLAPDVIEIY